MQSPSPFYSEAHEVFRETVRRFVAAEIAANNCNYFVPQMVFGDMTLQESLRSIELFGKHVMPALAE